MLNRGTRWAYVINLYLLLILFITDTFRFTHSQAFCILPFALGSFCFITNLAFNTNSRKTLGLENS
jgi:hypothetical protein